MSKLSKIGFSVFLIALVVACLWLLPPLLPWTLKSRMERIFIHGSLLDKRLGGAPSRMSVAIPAGDLILAGDLYKSEEASARYPAVLVVHGSTRWGRRLALYPLLAEWLAREGYLVLVMNLRGFGDSQTPTDTSSVLAWDSTKDVSAGLTFLESLDEVDGKQLFVLGHSLGGTWVLKASEKDSRIKKVVALGPGPRLKELSPRRREEFRARFSRDRHLEPPISQETFQKIYEATLLEAALEHFKGDLHQPVLLIDGELESEHNKAFLEEQYQQMTHPKRYIGLENAGHYLNVAGLEELQRFPRLGDLVVYDRRTLREAVAAIDGFLSE
jgi:alpha-beta hydrolase superfamily lysophospholipase